jgi:hypothetical protein
MKLNTQIFFLIFTLLLGKAFNGASQQVSVVLDPPVILIGEQVNLKLKVLLPAKDTYCEWQWPDTVSHFEQLSKSDGKLVNENGQSYFTQEIVFTSFDSGRWYLPSMTVITGSGNNRKQLLTDSIAVRVNYANMDSSGVLHDIRPILSDPFTDYTWWYIGGGILLALIIAYGLFRLWRKKRGNNIPLKGNHLSAYDEAMKALDAAGKIKLDAESGLLEYHTALSYLFKRYYGRICGESLMKDTTGDILLRMRKDKLAQDVVALLASPLRLCDAVKFARYHPDVQTSADCAIQMKESIDMIHNRFTSKAQTLAD